MQWLAIPTAPIELGLICFLLCFQIVAKYQLGPDKLHCLINFGLAPFFKGKLMNDVQNSNYNSLSFDESLKFQKWTSWSDTLATQTI